MKRNLRYGAIAAVFLLSVGYHMIIVLPKVGTEGDDKQDDATVITKNSIDIDGEHLQKTYDHVLLSRKGDWYRIGIVVQSSDWNESLNVSLVSSAGKKQDVGVMEFEKEDSERYYEFIVSTDGSYENVLIEGVRDVDSKRKWLTGGVRLADMFVSRLDIVNANDAKSLQPTAFGQHHISNVFTNGADSKSKGVKLSRNAHFLGGQTFEVTEDEYLLSVNMLLNQNGASGTGKYRLELRSYDPKTKKVGDQSLQRSSFSVKDLKDLSDNDGSYRLNIPFALKGGQSYFIGVSDDYVKSAKKIQLEPFKDNGGDFSVSHYFSLSVAENFVAQGERMMTHAVVEDLGSSLRYRYRSNHAVTDMMDVYESSDKVSFDNTWKAVVGKETAGTFFTYKIDTRQPFDTLRMQADQIGADEDQLRVEYSFDNAFWKAIPAKSQDKTARTFDEILQGDKTASTVFVRVSYAGSKDGSGVFGLSDFHVTATMPKDAVRKLSR